MSNSVELRVPASHPCIPGHFPGEPIVPGVVILDLIAENILSNYPDCRVGGFPQVKFLSPLVPETGFTLAWKERTDGHIEFNCDEGKRRLVQGRIELYGAR